MTPEDRIATLERQLAVLLKYLSVELDPCDVHPDGYILKVFPRSNCVNTFRLSALDVCGDKVTAHQTFDIFDLVNSLKK